MGFNRTCVKAALALTVFSWANVAQAVNYFITFGDSYSQTGFDVSSTKPSASNPLGNPAFPGWTTSGGANWIGDLVHDYNASLTYSFNFAYGGATVNASLVKPFQTTVKSFIDQVKQFRDSIASKPSYAAWTADNSLFGVWLGVNDVGNSYYSANETVLLGQIMDSYFGQIETVFGAGARNFVLLNVPPINKSPMMLGQSKAAQDTEAGVIDQFNKLLVQRSAEFVASHGGAKIVVVDTQAPFNTAISAPTKYGSKDATCYNSDGKTCLWFNDYHPGQAIHKLVAEAVAGAWKGPLFKTA
ncbi:carbohydrate esterase family 16 protein [Lindgomyces ingoldianus]|uniref:Carbohydrate esterase family 16 protein n=1 Tax=Lindgomyces ingoldianus TaxID=673940 RepID=A0ACB6R466_9PLEO|nr:carbohydrate esterase family 16 protein [Lindgomyces ingoldianus]KAF2474058.1 carbohydrate esterase family 16 protein [Lindgomyces ingoldianus]